MNSEQAERLNAPGSVYTTSAIDIPNPEVGGSSVFGHVLSLCQLTKPSIMLLVLATGATSLVLEGSMLAQPIKIGVFLLALYLTGGSANALNQYLERDIDSRMNRTRLRRPLPLRRIMPHDALAFSVVIGITGVLIFGVVFNWLTAAISFATILFYSLFYTLWLKPRTSQNIVIGGIAGSMAPVGAWTAAAGSLSLMPILLFLIVFLWTPPHFWSLACCFKDDYREVSLPMLPVTKGVTSTSQRIFFYVVLLILVSLTPVTAGAGWIYIVAALVVGTLLMRIAYIARRVQSYKSFWRLFKFSILYLFLLLLTLIVDRFV